MVSFSYIENTEKSMTTENSIHISLVNAESTCDRVGDSDLNTESAELVLLQRHCYRDLVLQESGLQEQPVN